MQSDITHFVQVAREWSTVCQRWWKALTLPPPTYYSSCWDSWHHKTPHKMANKNTPINLDYSICWILWYHKNNPKNKHMGSPTKSLDCPVFHQVFKFAKENEFQQRSVSPDPWKIAPQLLLPLVIVASIINVLARQALGISTGFTSRVTFSQNTSV